MTGTPEALVQAARDMAQEILSQIPDPADRLAYAERWAKFFAAVPATQAEAEAFLEAAETIKIFLEIP